MDDIKDFFKNLAKYRGKFLHIRYDESICIYDYGLTILHCYEFPKEEMEGRGVVKQYKKDHVCICLKCKQAMIQNKKKGYYRCDKCNALVRFHHVFIDINMKEEISKILETMEGEE